MTFAPLSDILFRYIVNVAMIDAPLAVPDAKEKPNNTNELILKLKNLYSDINKNIKGDVDAKKYDDAGEKIKIIDSVFEMIDKSPESEKLIVESNEPLIIVRSKIASNPSGYNPATSTNTDNEMLTISNVFEYNEKIGLTGTTTGTIKNPDKRLYIGFVGGIVTTSDDTNVNTEQLKSLKNVLTTFGESMITNCQGVVAGLKVSTIFECNNKTKLSRKEGNKDINSHYVLLDITDMYLSLFSAKNELLIERVNSGGELAVKINNKIVENLGMLPTVYNIVKIICDDVDIFFEKLSKCSDLAEREHNSDADKLKLLNEDKSINTNNIVYYSLRKLCFNKHGYMYVMQKVVFSQIWIESRLMCTYIHRMNLCMYVCMYACMCVVQN
jgi:hypothetical protein